MCVFEQLPIYILFFWSCEKKELHIFICDWKDREYSNGNQSQAYPFIIKLLFIAFRYELKVFGNFLFCFRATQSSLSNIRLIWIFLSILCVRACFCVCVCERFRIILHNFSLDVIGIVVCDGVNKNLAWFYQKIMKVILFYILRMHRTNWCAHIPFTMHTVHTQIFVSMIFFVTNNKFSHYGPVGIENN